MYIVFDIGGTYTRVATSTDLTTLQKEERFNTPKDFGEGLEILVGTIQKLVKDKKIIGIAGGVAGVIREGVVLRSPNLLEEKSGDIVTELRKQFACEVHVYNDAMFGALGEAAFGAGRGHSIIGYLTVGTGVGGARVVHGDIDAHTYGFEPGFQIVETSDSGTLDMVSGAEVARLQKNIQEVKSRFEKIIGVGVYNAILHWSPDIFILGGGMMSKEGVYSVERVEKYVKEYNEIIPTLPDICPAELGDKSTLYGALAYLKQQKG